MDDGNHGVWYIHSNGNISSYDYYIRYSYGSPNTSYGNEVAAYLVTLSGVLDFTFGNNIGSSYGKFALRAFRMIQMSLKYIQPD